MCDAVEMLRECGNDEMANDLEGKLAAEAIALRQYTAYDAAMGYARPAQ